MMHNNLFLNRLLIYTDKNEVAYDEQYHRGINIISGDNSSGKSTISHFIFYILGGAFNDWVKEAKRCSAVYAEVELNGAVVTLRREININPATNKANASEPIYFFWGGLDDGLKTSSEGWYKYNYNATENKKSFSNVLFENLGIPIVKGDNNVTFHQLLRLLYVDQESPTSSLFYYEQFDTTLTRETVSDLLLGVYNQELYDRKQRFIEAEREFEDIKKEIKVIKQFIPNELDLFPAHLLKRIANSEKEISKLETEIFQLKEQNKRIRFTQNTKLEFEKLNEESIYQRELVRNLESQISALKFEIEDSKYFIIALENKLKAVHNSILTRDFLGAFPLEYCPECLSPLTTVAAENHCKLCKENIDNSFGVTQARKIEQDLTFQIKESKSLLEITDRRLVELQGSFNAEKIKLNQLQTKVNNALTDVRSFRDEKIDHLYVEKGFLEGEIIQLRTLLENAELYQSLVAKRNLLEEEISGLRAAIDKITTAQAQLKLEINAAIERKGLYLLNNDLEHQDEFIHARQFHVDYRNNLAFIVDKDAKYSASSNFYLKTSARFAIFFASLEIERMRYPRFILCDNMEDKGIQERRAQNFQRIIIEEAEKHNSNTYQLIYTTSFLPEQLRDSNYVVGEYYTKTSRTLKHVD